MRESLGITNGPLMVLDGRSDLGVDGDDDDDDNDAVLDMNIRLLITDPCRVFE
jgi:hypothetical protein